MKFGVLLPSVALLSGIALAGSAQQKPAPSLAAPPRSAPPAGVAALGQTLDRDMAALHGYTYRRRIQVVSDGKDVGGGIEEVSFGPDGNMSVAVVSVTVPSLRARFGLRGALDKELLDKAKAEIKEILAFASRYVMPDPQTVRALAAKGKVVGPGRDGVLTLRAEGLLAPEDGARYVLSPAGGHLLRAHVDTSAQGHAMTIDAHYHTLPDGLNACAQFMVSVPDKGACVTVQAFDFERAQPSAGGK
jgi:hypothetical protein